MNFTKKYMKIITLLCIICSSMVGVVLAYRTPWTITGSIGGIIQLIGAMSIPLIGMLIGSSSIEDESTFKEYYKVRINKFIIPYIIYFIVLKLLTKGEYRYESIIGTILGMFILAPFLKEFLKSLSKDKLKYLVGLIFIGSIVNVYFTMFWINTTIDFSIFSSWLVFCIIGYAIPQINSQKLNKTIYLLGVFAAILTFAIRTVPIDTKLWSVSPTLILYSSAMFLLINEINWTCIHKVSIISKIVDFFEKHCLGIFFIHNYVIVYILNNKLNLSANRYKVIFGSAIVLILTLTIGGIISAIIDKVIEKNEERINNGTARLLMKIKDVNSYKHYLIWILLCLVITFMAESLLREGMEYALDFVHFNLHKKFIANFLLVLAATSPYLLFKRGYLVLGIISEALMGSAIASAIMYNFRGTPLTYSDFFAIKDGIAIAGEYVSTNMVIIAAIVILILILVNIKLGKIKIDKNRKNKKIAILIIISTIVYAKVNLNNVLEAGILSPVTWDIKYSYNQNGFYFSLYNSYLGYNREKPKLYNKENIEKIKENIIIPSSNETVLNENNNEELENADKEIQAKSEKEPNVILIQLESIMDPLTIEGVELTGDPLKNIRKISENTTSGKLFVPTYGGGTARTEFEVLTGMSLDYFSAGELPHNTYLKKECIESIAYVLDSDIYEKTLIHNYQGSFYERNKAYEHLGFERYIPVEYMYDRQIWDKEYPEDQLIIDNIKETLESTEKSDFIFAITVQTHGSYKTDYESEDSEIVVSGSLDEVYIRQLQDYVDDLVEVDRLIGELVEYVDNLEEPTILAAYSDHLPAYEPIGQQYTKEEQYTTQYFIYDNMGLEKQDKDLQAFQLSTELFNMLDLPGGVMNQFHRTYSGDANYETMLEYLQYDILDGKGYIYNQTKPYSRTKMKMGIKEIEVEEAKIVEDKLEVIGSNFNEYSCIYVDGKPINTEYIDKNTIIGELNNFKGKNVTVHQLTRRNKSLGQSNEVLISK